MKVACRALLLVASQRIAERLSVGRYGGDIVLE